MFADFFFVDGHSKAWSSVRRDCASGFVQMEAFFHHILTPWNVVMYGLANDIAWLGESKFDGSRGTHRPLRVMRSQSNSISVGQSRHTSGFGKSAAMGDVKLADFTASRSKEVAKRCQVGHSLASCNWSGDGCIDRSKPLNTFRPAWFFEKVKAIRFKSLGKLHSHGGRWPSMAIDHNVNVVSNSITHGRHAGLGRFDRLQPLNRHGGWYSHGFERCKSISNRL